METKSGICPFCKQQIEVNPSEEVDFCPLCGKAFSTQEAFKLEAERVKKDENSRKPPQEVMDKFNAILAQDFKLAKQYLDDFVKKEYPKLDISFFPDDNRVSNFLYKQKNPSRICSTFDTTMDSNFKSLIDSYANLEVFEKSYKNFYSLNPWLAGMFYEILCARTNHFLREMCGWNLTGELPILKLSLSSLVSLLNITVCYINHARSLYDNEHKSSQNSYSENSIKSWKHLEASIKLCEHHKGKEFDDAYISLVIDEIKRWAASTIDGMELCRDWMGYYYYGAAKKNAGEYLNEFLSHREIKSLDGLIALLEEYLSPNEQNRLAAEREAEAKRRREKERAEKDAKDQKAFQKALTFWQNYIDLLKAGKTKEALARLSKAKKAVKEIEVPKFKKKLFGMKYTGDVSALNAEELAKLATT